MSQELATNPVIKSHGFWLPVLTSRRRQKADYQTNRLLKKYGFGHLSLLVMILSTVPPSEAEAPGKNSRSAQGGLRPTGLPNAIICS